MVKSAATFPKTETPKATGAFPRNVALAKLVHTPNALLSTEMTLSGIVIVVKFVQPQNALFLIKATLFGNVIDDRLVHSKNAKVPIEVTLFGIVIVVRFVQPENT